MQPEPVQLCSGVEGTGPGATRASLHNLQGELSDVPLTRPPQLAGKYPASPKHTTSRNLLQGWFVEEEQHKQTQVSRSWSSQLLPGQSTYSTRGAYVHTDKRKGYTNKAVVKWLIFRSECDGIKYVKVCLREINIPVWSEVQCQQSGIIWPSGWFLHLDKQNQIKFHWQVNSPSITMGAI